MSIWVLTLIFTPMILATLLYLIDHEWFSYSTFLQQGILLMLLWILTANHMGDATIIGGWKQGIGIRMTLDALAVPFLWMSWISCTYAQFYNWEGRKGDHKYLFLVNFLQGVLYAIFLVSDLFSIFIVIEIAAIIVSILITYTRDGASVRAGLYYLLINSIAMVFVLLGVVWIYIQAGTLDIELINQMINGHAASDLVILAVGCLAIGFMVKAAIFPVNGWLPIAHGAAPSEISALLSGLLVKMGVYGLIRIVAMVPSYMLEDFLLYVALLTAITGVVRAMFQKDIKRMLAYHTVSQVGLLMLGIFSGSSPALLGGIVHMSNHFLFKSLLFLTAGMISERYGTRTISKIKGLWQCDKWLSVFLVIGVLHITGTPFFLGSISKDLIKKGMDTGLLYWGLQLVNLGTMVSFMKLLAMLPGPDGSIRNALTSQYVTTGFVALVSVALIPVEWQWLGQQTKYFSILSVDGSILFASELIAAVVFRRFAYPQISLRFQHALIKTASFRDETLKMALVLVVVWVASIWL